jgi:hypothetical protein
VIFRFGHQGLLVTAGCDLLTGLLLLISSLLFCRSAAYSYSAVMNNDHAVLPQMLLVTAVSQLLSIRAVYSSIYE